jgi:hypothetical protein
MSDHDWQMLILALVYFVVFGGIFTAIWKILK